MVEKSGYTLYFTYAIINRLYNFIITVFLSAF